jgi:outer membrane protein TolC
VNAARADAAGARADARRTADEIAFKVKELFYAILTTERRRDAMDAQIRAIELRTVETRNAVDTGVALEMKAVEVRAQIAQTQHARGQLQDAVADMKLELADLGRATARYGFQSGGSGCIRFRVCAPNDRGRTGGARV